MSQLRLPNLEFARLFAERLHPLVTWLRGQFEGREDEVLTFPRDGGDGPPLAARIERLANGQPARGRLVPLETVVDSSSLLRVRVALDLADAHIDPMAALLTEQVRAILGTLADRKLVEATAVREKFLVTRWPRPRAQLGLGPLALHALTAQFGHGELPEGELPPDPLEVDVDPETTRLQALYWPPEAALLDVAQWARAGLNRLGSGGGDRLVEEVDRGVVPLDRVIRFEERDVLIPAAGIALAYLAERDVRAGMNRKMMAIDASKVHHDMMGGMRDWPKDGQRHRGDAFSTRTIRDGDQIERVELLAQGSTTQLHLPLDEIEGMQDHAIEALRRLRGAKGLRHWAALLRLFTIEGGRSGTYRWLLNEHLAAMGYDERQCRDPKVRAEAAREVEALAGLELAIYTKGGVLRERRRLLLETGRFERLERSEWKLDGIEFQMNQRVYGGVRESTGEIGHKWMPAPAALAAVDHVRFPYAHALGMLLAIRFRWRIDEQRDFLDIAGEKLLGLGGIRYQKTRDDRAWEKLRRALDELQRVAQIASYQWLVDEDAWTLHGTCRIIPAQWTLDRAVRGVIPPERPTDPSRPVTGAELRRWREKHGWSIREAARHLKVTHQAISKAEAKPDEPLGHKLRTAVDPILTPDP